MGGPGGSGLSGVRFGLGELTADERGWSEGSAADDMGLLKALRVFGLSLDEGLLGGT